MIRRIIKITTALVFTGAAVVIGALVLFPKTFSPRDGGGRNRQSRIISPRPPVPAEDTSSTAERLAQEDRLNARVALEEGELIIATLNSNFDSDPQEEQIIAYRNLAGTGGFIHITYIDYDEQFGGYRRTWSAPTAVTRPLTLSLYTQDLIGDRSVCILAAGMNDGGEHTLSVFRKEDGGEGSPAFNKIAEFRIDGTISVQETERTQAYQLGLTRGQSFPIVAYSRDHRSANILDQLEITYTYNREQGLYEQAKSVPIPGKELEQRRVRELLGGSSGAFESFITGLWYYVSPQGTLDNRQYIYFDPLNRELIFYGDETQQVFTWQNSSATRYGLYISSQNISVTTLRRFLDIELESLDSIRIRVFEDVRLKIGVSAPWDGSYRKAASPADKGQEDPPVPLPYRDAVYEGPPGRLRLFQDGSYELASGGSNRRGAYAFFPVNDREFLELRPAGPRSPGFRSGPAEDNRETYLVERSKNKDGEGEKLNLQPVRLGARGIQELHEPAITLTEIFQQ